MNPSRQAKIRFYLRLLAIFIVTFDAAFLWQKFSGAHESEFGAHPDEAAHYVTGLFVRDAIVSGGQYATGGFHGSPVQVGKEFADNFYEHYPKVALGVWPPAFYLVQSAWTLPFGESRLSVLTLMAVLAGLVAMVLFEATYRAYGLWPAVAAGVLWLCAPLARELYGMIMAETLSTLCIFGAALVWGRYLDERRKWDALWFALLASAAIMTKGTGLALVLMCGLSIAFRHAWSIFKRPSLWVALLLILLLAGVWTWHFRRAGLDAGGWDDDSSGGLSWNFTKSAIRFYSLALAGSLGGYALAGFALVGMLRMFRENGRWAALTALVLGVWIFQVLLPVGREDRHLLPATPALVLLAIAGLHVLARGNPRWTAFLAPIFGAWLYQAVPRVARALAPDWRPAWALPLLLAVVVLSGAAFYLLARRRVPRVLDPSVQRQRELHWVLLLALLVLPFSFDQSVKKTYRGFEALALQLLDKQEPGARVLVCSDASGEGMFISEIAMRDKRPNLIIERGSKSLVDPKTRSWSGRNLRLLFGDDEDLFKYLLESKIAYIVLDTAAPKSTAYHDQLKRVVEDRDHVGLFFPVADSPITRDGEDLAPPIQLYRIIRKDGPL